MQMDRINLEPRTLLGVHETVRMADLTEYFGRAFAASSATIAGQGLVPTGPPIALYHGTPTDTIDITAGFPVDAAAVAGEGLVLTPLPVGPAVTTVYVGPYDGMTRTYDQIAAWLQAEKLTPRQEMWEEYLTDPDTNPDPATWQTRIVFPLA